MSAMLRTSFQIGIVEDGVDERFGLQLAEVIMSTHPLTTAQGLAMLSAFR